jgi:glycopeptide antibiotics resistance protein
MDLIKKSQKSQKIIYAGSMVIIYIVAALWMVGMLSE